MPPLFPGTQLPTDLNAPRQGSGGLRPRTNRGIPLTLEGILREDFTGELDRLSASQPDLEGQFLDALNKPVDFDAFRGALTDFAQGVTTDVFGRGGLVQQEMGAANVGAIRRGLSPFGGTAESGRQEALGRGTDIVSRAIGQQAGQLAGVASQNRANDLSSLLGFTQFQGGRADSLRESLFGGQATIEQLGLATEAQDLNRRLIEQALSERQGGGGIGGFLGKIGGGLLGSALGPIGSALGAKLGGSLFGGSDFGPQDLLPGG